MELNLLMACPCKLDPQFPSAWTRGLGSLQVLTPLWIALFFSILSQTAVAPTCAPVLDGGAQYDSGRAP